MISSLHERGHTAFDRGDNDRLGFRKVVSLERQSRATVRAEGVRLSATSAFSARRRRAAHSATTRRHPRKPCCLSRRHNSAPLRCPPPIVRRAMADVLQGNSPEPGKDPIVHHAALFGRVAAISGSPHDLLDRHPSQAFQQSQRWSLPAAESPHIGSLGRGQQSGLTLAAPIAPRM